MKRYDGVKNEKFEYYGGSLKNPSFRGSHNKLIYRGNCLTREAWTVCRFKGVSGGELGQREGVLFSRKKRGGGRVITKCTLVFLKTAMWQQKWDKNYQLSTKLTWMWSHKWTIFSLRYTKCNEYNHASYQTPRKNYFIEK